MAYTCVFALKKTSNKYCICLFLSCESQQLFISINGKFQFLMLNVMK